MIMCVLWQINSNKIIIITCTAARADSCWPILWVAECEAPLTGSCPHSRQMNTSSGCRR